MHRRLIKWLTMAPQVEDQVAQFSKLAYLQSVHK